MQQKDICDPGIKLEDFMNIVDKGGISLTQNFYGGTYNGVITGVNNGNINVNQNLDKINKINTNLSELLKQLEEEQITQWHTRKVIDNLIDLKEVTNDEKESLFKKLVNNCEKLVIVAEASSKLYPIAQNAFELIKGLMK